MDTETAEAFRRLTEKVQTTNDHLAHIITLLVMMRDRTAGLYEPLMVMDPPREGER